MRIITIIIFSCFFSIAANKVEAQSGWAKKADVNYAKANNLDGKLTKKEKQFIVEVFGDKADELVFNDVNFLKSIKHLLRNRITIKKIAPNSKGKKGLLLSQVAMSNDYVLQKKENVNSIENFNPLKYKMAFFSKGTYMYIIDNTDYVIQIKSQYRK